MMLACGPRLAKIIPRLASDQPGEIVATVAAIRRTLSAAGLDLHDLAREIETPVPAEIPHRARRPRHERAPRAAALSPEALRLLRAGLDLDTFTAWERSFIDTILTAAQRRRDWHPTKKQTDVIARLINKAQEAEQHP